jgi:hypothetical protein
MKLQYLSTILSRSKKQERKKGERGFKKHLGSLGALEQHWKVKDQRIANC